jgi:hypothetical protein
MVVRPLAAVGVDVAKTDIPSTIYRETGGQPELIQVFGRALFAALDTPDGLPTASQLQASVLESDAFRRRVLGTFLANTTPYEELACYLLIRSALKENHRVEDFTFTLGEVEAALAAEGVALSMADLVTLATNLEIAGALSPVAGAGSATFEFSVPQLARYCQILDLDLCIRTARRRVRQQGAGERSLLDDR